jgi:3-oxoacyl-[acyl-carrier protein] reductase
MIDPVLPKPIMLITGTSRGIGEYLANYYVGKGFHVIGCSRSEASISLPDYTHYILDVADEQQVIKIFREIKNKFGHLKVLINNAGISSYNHSMLTSISTVRKVFETNVVGTFLFSREAAKLMKKSPGGRIINISSVSVPMKLQGEAVYVASKAAINAFTEILSREFSDFGITVNAVGPTPIMTNIINDIPKEKIARLVEMIPLKKMGEFSDVTNVIDFFIKPESHFVNGQILYLGGI